MDPLWRPVVGEEFVNDGLKHGAYTEAPQVM